MIRNWVSFSFFFFRFILIQELLLLLFIYFIANIFRNCFFDNFWFRKFFNFVMHAIKVSNNIHILYNSKFTYFQLKPTLEKKEQQQQKKKRPIGHFMGSRHAEHGKDQQNTLNWVWQSYRFNLFFLFHITILFHWSGQLPWRLCIDCWVKKNYP